MLNKVIIMGVLAFVSISSQARERNIWPDQTVKYVCKPEVKPHPFDQFTLTIAKKKSRMDITFSKDSGYWDEQNPDVYVTTDKNDISDDLSLGIMKIEKIDSNEDSVLEADIYADFNDWGAVKLQIGADDEGYSAFVFMYTDGPSIRSFYRCVQK